MKWDTYHTREIKEKYIFRYVTIEKLIDFLTSNSIYLSRLDTFEDCFEGIQPIDLNKLRSLYTEKPHDASNEISEEMWNEIIERDRKYFNELQFKIISDQKKRFVSCWILSDVESFGMWDTYGKSGFAIRFEHKDFQRLIRESINIQEYPTNIIDLLVAGEVQYQNFDTMLNNEKEYLIKYSVFRKHLSFKHESEYRIVGFSDKLSDKTGVRFKLPNFEKLNFEIIANPRLSQFQIQQYQNIISNYSKKHVLSISELKTWLDFRDLKY
jgi:hypothetical protein